MEGQEGFRNDPDAYGFVQSQYEPISSQIDPFQTSMNFRKTEILVLVLVLLALVLLVLALGG